MDSLYTTGLLELQNMELEQRSLVQEGMIKERDLTILRLTRQLHAAHKVLKHLSNHIILRMCVCVYIIQFLKTLYLIK